jgi:hypothetical protein
MNSDTYIAFKFECRFFWRNYVEHFEARGTFDHGDEFKYSTK